MDMTTVHERALQIENKRLQTELEETKRQLELERQRSNNYMAALTTAEIGLTRLNAQMNAIEERLEEKNQEWREAYFNYARYFTILERLGEWTLDELGARFSHTRPLKEAIDIESKKRNPFSKENGGN